MVPAQSLPAAQLLPLLTRDVIEAIADRPNESDARRQARADGVRRMIEVLAPEDGVEIMLAGQAVLTRELLLDAVHDSHRVMMADDAHRHRQQAMALGRLQLSFLKEIGRRRAAHPAPMEDAAAATVSAPAAVAQTRPVTPPGPDAGAPVAVRLAVVPPPPPNAAQSVPAAAAAHCVPAAAAASVMAAQPRAEPAQPRAVLDPPSPVRPREEPSKPGIPPLLVPPSRAMPPPGLAAHPASAAATT